jgi:hypothetical protein
MMAFVIRVLRRIFEQERDEVTGGLRQLYNNELYNLVLLEYN